MILKIEKSFYKSLDKIDYGRIVHKIEALLSEIEEAESIKEIKNLKKMVGYRNYYRIKIADYRIGIELQDQSTVVLIIIAHRKEIYRKFP